MTPELREIWTSWWVEEVRALDFKEPATFEDQIQFWTLTDTAIKAKILQPTVVYGIVGDFLYDHATIPPPDAVHALYTLFASEARKYA